MCHGHSILGGWGLCPETCLKAHLHVRPCTGKGSHDFLLSINTTADVLLSNLNTTTEIFESTNLLLRAFLFGEFIKWFVF